MKKIAKPLAFIVFLLILCLCFCSCQKPTAKREHFENDKQRTILYLGDSIAEAMAGPSPLTERETYGYYGILGRINGFDFYNRAISGDQTNDLLSFIQREDDGVNMVKSLVNTADIIHISIGGNDLLGYNISEMIIEAGTNNTDTAEYRMEIAYNNLDKIITELRRVNPEAIIVLQTLYNPVGNNSPLVSNYAKLRLASMSYTENDYHRLAGRVIDCLNNMLKKYLEDNANKFSVEPYYLVDVGSLFEDIYKSNPTRWARLFCPDGIHPANEGHALIAQANQSFFQKIGIASSDALAKYKQLRVDQLSRLYSNAVVVSTVKNEIENCDTFADVSLAYFNATAGKDINYRYADAAVAGKHFEKDKTFSVSKLSVRGLDLTKVNVPQLKTSFDIMDESSYISFKADGTFEMKYTVKKGLIVSLEKMESFGLFSLPINLTELIDMDINYLQGLYLKHMFPGFDYENIAASLELIEESAGFSIVGLDIDKQTTREMTKELADTGDLILRTFDVLDDSLGIIWKGQYRIVEQTSALTGEMYYAIYVGEYFYEGETYLRFTYTPDEENGDKLRLTVDVVNFVLEGAE